MRICKNSKTDVYKKSSAGITVEESIYNRKNAIKSIILLKCDVV